MLSEKPMIFPKEIKKESKTREIKKESKRF